MDFWLVNFHTCQRFQRFFSHSKHLKHISKHQSNLNKDCFLNWKFQYFELMFIYRKQKMPLTEYNFFDAN